METLKIKKQSLKPIYPSYFKCSSLNDLMVKTTHMLMIEAKETPSRKVKKVSGTEEWASMNVNFINGCSHDCKYCYAKSMAIRFKRVTPQTWKNEDINLKRYNTSFKPQVGYTMFPTSHDISPDNIEYSLEFLKRLLTSGHHVLLVTKPHLSVIGSICDRFFEYKDKILFRFTIGSSNSETLRFWEPYAPSFEERLASLQHAFKLGFETSVSCEPALDANTEELVNILMPYVTDAIWIGLPNRLKGILKLNGADDFTSLKYAEELIKIQNNTWVTQLYNNLKNNAKIKWKDSIKKIIGIDRPSEKGLDI